MRLWLFWRLASCGAAAILNTPFIPPPPPLLLDKTSHFHYSSFSLELFFIYCSLLALLLLFNLRDIFAFSTSRKIRGPHFNPHPCNNPPPLLPLSNPINPPPPPHTPLYQPYPSHSFALARLSPPRFHFTLPDYHHHPSRLSAQFNYLVVRVVFALLCCLSQNHKTNDHFKQ